MLYPDSSQAAKALVMNGTVFRGHTIQVLFFRNDIKQVRFSTTTYVDPVNAYTCPSIRDLTEDYYGKIVHRFNSSEYAQIPWHMPSRKLHVVGLARVAELTVVSIVRSQISARSCCSCLATAALSRKSVY